MSIRNLRVCLILLLFSAAARAQMDGRFVFQTIVTNPSTGSPMTGPYNMRFTVYNAMTGGDALWTEDHAVTLNQQGWLNVILATGYPFNRTEQYVGITVLPGSTEMTPRHPYHPVPCSYVSENILSPGGISVFKGNSTIRMTDGEADFMSVPFTGMLSIHAGGYTSTPLQLSSASTTLIRGETARQNGIEISTAAGVGVVGKSTGGWRVQDDPAGPYFPSTGVRGEGYEYGGYFIGSGFPWSGGAPGTGGYFEGNRYAGLFKGKVHARGDYTREYGSGDETRAMPIAYGTVGWNGTVSGNSPNVATAWDATAQCYKITITGENFEESTHAALITPYRRTRLVTVPAGGHGLPRITILPPVFGQVYGSGGVLCVELFTADGAKVQRRFAFVVYRP